MAEAVAFTALVLFDIWFLHSRTFWGDAAVGLFAVVSLVAHRAWIGFGAREFFEALLAWWIILLVCSIAVGAGCAVIGHPLGLLWRGCVYFVWCVIQQVLLQNVIYGRVRSSYIAALLFAVVHLPNPVLVPATFAWGFVSTRLFEKHPSIFALALLQTLSSSLLLWLTPVAWSHQFRVGPGYWHFVLR